MENKETTIKLLEISNKIMEIVEDRDELTQSDYQCCIEAQVRIAYLLGMKKGGDLFNDGTYLD